MIQLNEISERMYEAAFIPELWTPLLDDLAKATHSGVGDIGIHWPEQRRITTTFQISSGSAPWEQPRDELERWLTHIRSNSFINRGFLQLDPLLGDWEGIPDFDRRLQRHIDRGYGAQARAVIELFGGEILTLEFTRRLGEPRYEEALIMTLNHIHPAFQQAAFFASRLRFERARSSVEILNGFGLPAALLNSAGHILLANDLFESVDRYVLKAASGHVTLRGADNLRKVFASAIEQSAEKSINVPIPANDQADAAVIRLMPLCRDAQSIFSTPCTIMVLSPVATTVGVPSAEIVSKLFGLTPAEARLATALTSGLSLRDCAAVQGITVGTARVYLIRIFSKTGTNQQSELVSLLKSVSVVASRPVHPHNKMLSRKHELAPIP